MKQKWRRWLAIKYFRVLGQFELRFTYVSLKLCQNIACSVVSSDRVAG